MANQERKNRPAQAKSVLNKRVENKAEIESMDQENRSIPVVEEKIRIDKREVVTGKVRVTKRVRERVETVNLPGYQEKIEVERVPINRVVDRPASIRQEGETTIIPIMEEAYVLEKRLILKEEVRIHKRRIEKPKSKKVTLKREEPVIEHIDLRSEHSIDKNKNGDPLSKE